MGFIVLSSYKILEILEFLLGQYAQRTKTEWESFLLRNMIKKKKNELLQIYYAPDLLLFD